MTKTTKQQEEKCEHDFSTFGNAGEGYYEFCLKCNKTKPCPEDEDIFDQHDCKLSPDSGCDCVEI